MSFLEINGERQVVPPGDSSIGSDGSNAIVLTGDGVAGVHLHVHATDDGQVSVKRPGAEADTQINGVRLGPQPTPLLHGDKIAIAGHELLFVDERRSGSTQFVSAEDLARLQDLQPKPKKKAVATEATGGRIVSLTDGREYPILTTPLVLGREAGCDVVVTSKRVSRRHAEIVPTPKGYIVVDTSTNGTFVNGEKIDGERLLARADVIRVGDDEFRFYADVRREPEPAADPEAPPAAPEGAEQQLNNTMHGIPMDAARPSQPTKPAQTPIGAEFRLNDTMHGIPGAGAPPPAPAARPSASALAHLLCRSGPLKGQRFPIRVPVVNVGRAEYNDIVIADGTVSTIHAKLQRREGIWVLVDLDSTNGTFVDGEQVSGETPLAPGAIVRFGDVSTVFEPTDDEAGTQGGSGTMVLGAVNLPSDPPAGQDPDREAAEPDSASEDPPRKKRGIWPFK